VTGASSDGVALATEPVAGGGVVEAGDDVAERADAGEAQSE